MRRYHKRSNVESTFSAVKRKFGDSVMSRSDAGMMNEVLCKFLCHNVTCLIQEQETLGIAPVFWKDEADELAIPKLACPEQPMSENGKPDWPTLLVATAWFVLLWFAILVLVGTAVILCGVG